MKKLLVLTCVLLAAIPAFADNTRFDQMTSIGDVATMQRLPDGLLLTCADASQVRLQVLAPDLVRVRAAFRKPLPAYDHSWAIARTHWPAVPVNIHETPAAISLRTPELVVRIQRKPLLIQFDDAHTGRVINADAIPMRFDPGSGAVAAAKNFGSDEHIYGLGEKAAHLDKRHGHFTMWNSDTPGYTWDTDPLYQTIPFYIGLLMNHARAVAYGIFFDNSYRSYWDIASLQPEYLIFGADGGLVNYYFFYGPSMKKILGRYTELTGRMPLPPRWALGNQQSRYSYANERQVRSVVSRYRADKIPLDVLHLDIHYMNGYRDFTWNPQRFPHPARLLRWLRGLGVKVVTIVDPGIKYEPGGNYSVYNDGAAHGYFLKHRDGKTYVGRVWPGPAVFVDYTLAAAAKWWGGLHRALLDQGVAGIWNDMNEPADFDSRDGKKWMDVVNYDQGQHTTHAKNRNLFALLECKATYQGLQRLRPDRRPYVITRAGYAGIQRWSTMWTGDSRGTWSSLALTLPMFESLGLSGETFVGADCGGFMGRPEGELLVRWYQVGFLTPFLRNHHVIDNYDQEPWRFGQRDEDIIRKYVRLRYRLLPYLYTVLAEAHQTGVPWFRPLILENQDDSSALNVDDEFMAGGALLAAPILRDGARRRDVYLPPGEWYDYWTDRRLRGGRTVTVAAPLDKIPLFVRAGSIVPTGPVTQYLGQQPADPVTLQIYPDAQGNASGRLYEDDGVSPDYLKGAFRETALRWSHGELHATLTHAGYRGATLKVRVRSR